jgi:SPP1 gp7 family putative phage head morphogenesis protein
MRDFRHEAELSDRDREELARIGVPFLSDIGTAIQRAVLGAVQDRADPRTIRKLISSNTGKMTPVIIDCMVSGHLQGRIRAVVRAAGSLTTRGMAFGAYDEALEQFAKRLDLSDADIERLRKLYSNEAVRVTRSTNDVLDAKATAAIKESLELGEHTQAATERMRQAFAAAGVVPDNNFLCETLARTQIQLAYGAGAWNANQAPEIQEILKGFHYSAVSDGRTRPNHLEMDGCRADKDSEIWAHWWIPNGFRCRCGIVAIFDDFEEDIPDPMPDPDEGWDYDKRIVFADDGLNDK